MSAIAHNARRQPAVRPVVQGVPGLKLVPTPAPARGFFVTVAICAALFILTFGTVFYLNTKMVDTAYEVQTVKKELNAVTAMEATLQDELIDASTPQNLMAKAQELGLQAATSVVHLDLATSTIITPAQSKDK